MHKRVKSFIIIDLITDLLSGVCFLKNKKEKKILLFYISKNIIKIYVCEGVNPCTNKCIV